MEQARAEIEQIVADLGLELYDLEFAGGVVRVTVDRAGGVDLEAIADVTRIVSRQLDHLDPFTGSYTLEVSSPGLERTLRTPDHYRRAVGCVVSVRTHPDVEGDRRMQGVLAAADDDGITVKASGEMPGSGGRRLRYQDIERTRTVFTWGAEPSAGRTGATRKVSR